MIGWKKNLQKFLSLNERINALIEQKSINEGGENPDSLPKMSLSIVSQMLSVNRTSVYYIKESPTEFELKVKRRIDELHTDHPTWGQRQLSNQLKFDGMNVGRRKARRYMEEMAIRTTYPKPNLSTPAKNHKIYPYLLKTLLQPGQIKRGQSI